MISKIVLALILVAGSLQAQYVGSISVYSPPPQPVNPWSIRVQINGTRGSRTMFYWIVANYTRGPAIPSNPIRVFGVPDTYGPSNNVVLTWSPLPDASSYTILRSTDSRLTYGEECNCLVQSGVTGSSFTDTYNSTSSFVPTTIPAITGTIQLDNQTYEQPTWVFDPPVSGIGGGGVQSFNSRTGAVTPQAGDYSATLITNNPAGNISSTNVQSAINELDAEKAAASHTHGASEITSGVLPVIRGGTGLSTLVGGRCIQSRSDGTGFEETAGPCGAETGSSAYSADFASSTTWTVTGSSHGLGTCDLAYEITVSSGSLRQVTHGFTSISCETAVGDNQYNVVVTWPVATAGRITLIRGGGGVSGGGSGSLPGGSPGQVQYNAGSGTFGGLLGSTVSGSTLTLTGTLDVSGSYLGPRGTALPGTCSVGQQFFLTTAPAGRNLYGCTASNTWTLLGDGGGGGDGSFDPSGDYDLSGVNIVNIQTLTIYRTNGGSGTVQYRLVCLRSDGTVETCGLTNAARTLGVCYAGCGSSGNARVAIGGLISCSFDGSVTAGNWVAPSSSQAGYCTDAGTTKPSTALGLLVESGSGSSVYQFVKGIL